jgi:hypothetical protein
VQTIHPPNPCMRNRRPACRPPRVCQPVGHVAGAPVQCLFLACPSSCYRLLLEAKSQAVGSSGKHHPCVGRRQRKIEMETPGTSRAPVTWRYYGHFDALLTRERAWLRIRRSASGSTVLLPPSFLQCGRWGGELEGDFLRSRAIAGVPTAGLRNRRWKLNGRFSDTESWLVLGRAGT